MLPGTTFPLLVTNVLYPFPRSTATTMGRPSRLLRRLAGFTLAPTLCLPCRRPTRLPSASPPIYRLYRLRLGSIFRTPGCLVNQARILIRLRLLSLSLLLVSHVMCKSHRRRYKL